MIIHLLFKPSHQPLLFLLLLAPLIMSAQYRKDPPAHNGSFYKSYRRRVNDQPEPQGNYFAAPAVGFGSMHNHQLNEWISSYGYSSTSAISVVDFFNVFGYVTPDWQMGVSFGGFVTDNRRGVNGYYFSFNGGRNIIRTSRFLSNLNGNLLMGTATISEFVPQSISNPDPKKILWCDYVGIGFSNSNYCTVFKWKNKRIPLSLMVGAEYGINFIAQVQNSWKYGYASRSANGHSIDVPEVPRLDTNFTYLKFLVALRF